MTADAYPNYGFPTKLGVQSWGPIMHNFKETFKNHMFELSCFWLTFNKYSAHSWALQQRGIYRGPNTRMYRVLSVYLQLLEILCLHRYQNS